VAFHCGGWGGCEEAVVTIPVELPPAHHAPAAWVICPATWAAAALKPAIGPVLHFGAVEITPPFSFFFFFFSDCI